MCAFRINNRSNRRSYGYSGPLKKSRVDCVSDGFSEQVYMPSDAVEQDASCDHSVCVSQSISVPIGLPGNPRIVPRNEHCISRRNIDPDALKVMYRLLKHNHLAFLVGGSVRDLLLGKHPKDFDISTDVRPNEMRSLFRNSRIIGKRFRLVQVFFGKDEVIEVSTFRKPSYEIEDGFIKTLASDNTFGDPQTDALRRDITINGLFYDVRNFSVVDYVGGMNDLREGIVRIIGDPYVRIKEDPIRAFRAIRHAARNNFTIENATYDAICNSASQMSLCPKSRIDEEVLRELRYGSSSASFALCEKTGLLKHMIPVIWSILKKDTEDNSEKKIHDLLNVALKRIDQRSKQGVELSPSLLFSALFVGMLNGELSYAIHIGKNLEKDVAAKYVIHQLWSHNPFADCNNNGETASSLSVDDTVALARNGIVHSVVLELSKQLGISRKERDHMEQLLVARLQMFGAFLGQSDIVVFKRKSYFEDALELLRLTAYNELSKHCYEFWESHASSFKTESAGIKKKTEADTSRAKRNIRQRNKRHGYKKHTNNDKVYKK